MGRPSDVGFPAGNGSPPKPTCPNLQHSEGGRAAVRILFKDKRNSSGTIKDGQIILYISSRAPRAEQARHIEVLTEKLEVKLAQAKAKALADGKRIAPPPGLTPSPIQTNDQLSEWADQINQRFYRFAAMGEVRFRKQASRWGSCSGRTRNLQISERLRGGPHELLEYVLIHEIAHLGEFNHSDRFWSLVERACPDFRDRRKLLREYELYLRSLPAN